MAHQVGEFEGAGGLAAGNVQVEADRRSLGIGHCRPDLRRDAFVAGEPRAGAEPGAAVDQAAGHGDESDAAIGADVGQAGAGGLVAPAADEARGQRLRPGDDAGAEFRRVRVEADAAGEDACDDAELVGEDQQRPADHAGGDVLEVGWHGASLLKPDDRDHEVARCRRRSLRNRSVAGVARERCSTGRQMQLSPATSWLRAHRACLER